MFAEWKLSQRRMCEDEAGVLFFLQRSQKSGARLLTVLFIGL